MPLMPPPRTGNQASPPPRPKFLRYLQRFDLSRWTQFHTASLSAVPTSFSSISVLGGAGTSFSDPLDGWYAVGPAMLGADGATLDVTSMWMALLSIAETTAPALTSDIAIVVGILNEASDSGTVDGAFTGYLFTGGTRTRRRGTLQDGTVILGSAPGSSANIRREIASLHRCGLGASAIVPIFLNYALDSSDAILSGVGNPALVITNAPTWGASPVYPFVAIHRTSITDGTTRVVGVDPGGLALDPSSVLS